MDSVEVHIGHQYFGSGGYTAGYRVLHGEVREHLISEKDNGFCRTKIVRLEPITDEAQVEFWAIDAIGNPLREVGPNGSATLKR